LPDPVGATTRALRPAAIDCQAPSCEGVGAANALSNQVRVMGEKPSFADQDPGADVDVEDPLIRPS
jgi:hypothetical protein